MTNAEMNIGDFWGFVVSRYAHRNARGEFIRAVRRVVSEGADPEAWMEGAGLRFAREARGLRLEYGRKMAREFGTADTGAAAVRPAMPPPWSLGGRPDGRPGAGALYQSPRRSPPKPENRSRKTSGGTRDAVGEDAKRRPAEIICGAAMYRTYDSAPEFQVGTGTDSSRGRGCSARTFPRKSPTGAWDCAGGGS